MLILHADHEQNCSTATAAWSGRARPISSILRRRGVRPCAAGFTAVANWSVMKHAGTESRPAASRSRNTWSWPSRRIAASRLWARPPASTKTTTRGQGVKSRLSPDAGKAQGKESPSATSPSNWRKSPSRTPTSSNGSFTPTIDFYSGIILRAMGIPTICHGDVCIAACRDGSPTGRSSMMT